MQIHLIETYGKHVQKTVYTKMHEGFFDVHYRTNFDGDFCKVEGERRKCGSCGFKSCPGAHVVTKCEAMKELNRFKQLAESRPEVFSVNIIDPEDM